MTMRERILEKAEELFIKYGIKRITMDEIAAKLGISKKTIYQSFTDKNELVVEIFNKHISCSEQNCSVQAEEANNAVHEMLIGYEIFCTTMQSMNPSVLNDLEKYHPDVFKRFTEFKNQFVYKHILNNIKRGTEEGLYKTDINATIIAKMRLATILLSTNIELFPRHQFTLSEVEREIIMHFLAGIVTSKGAKMLKKYDPLVTTNAHLILN